MVDGCEASRTRGDGHEAETAFLTRLMHCAMESMDGSRRLVVCVPESSTKN